MCDLYRPVFVKHATPYRRLKGIEPGPFMQTLLNEILEEVRPLIGKGKVAYSHPCAGRRTGAAVGHCGV